METPRSWLSVFLLGVVALSCGKEEPPPPPPPVLNVTLESPGTAWCSSFPVIIAATITGGVPNAVEVLENGKTIAWLSAPYQYSYDCAARAEGTYTIIVQAYLPGYAFASPPKQIVVDRVRPTVVSGPFLPNQPEIAKEAPIQVTFSEPMLPVAANSVSLVSATKTHSWSADQKVLTVVPLETFNPPQTLTLILFPEGFRDLAGNKLSPDFPPMQWSWTLPAFLHTWSLPKYGNGLSSLEPPAFARDSKGRQVVAWFEFTSASGATNVYVHRSGESTNTLLDGPLSALPGPDTWVEDVQVAVDASDRPVVAWTERWSGELQVFARRWNGAAWEAMGSIPNPVVGADAKDLTIATGKSDLPALAWTEVDSSQRAQVYVYRWDGTKWDPVGSRIAARTTTASALFPSLVIDGQNRPVVSVTEQSGDTTFREEAVVWRLNGSIWQQLGSALRPATASSTAYVSRTSLALDPDGNPGLAFELITPGTTTSSEVWFARYAQTGWTVPQLVGGTSARWPSVTFDTDGQPWVTWESGDSADTLSMRVRRISGNASYDELPQLYRPRFANGSVGPPAILTIDAQRKAAQVVLRQ
jgi:hypothetical protein